MWQNLDWEARISCTYIPRLTFTSPHRVFGTFADPGDDDDNDLDDDADLAEELMLGMENGVSWLEADRDELGESCNMSQCLEKVKSRMLKITTGKENNTFEPQ